MSRSEPWSVRRLRPRKPCAIEGCTNLTAPSGGRICQTHRWRWRHYRDYNHVRRRPVEERFWEKVDKSGSPCWLWTSAKDRDGYGLFQVHPRQIRAHRFSYELEHGAIPEGMVVMHTCDRPSCVNPAHLRIGTNADNSADASRKGRRLPGSKNHQAKLTEAQVIEMRERYARGGVTQTVLAKEYGVSHALVSVILTRKAWKHI